MKNCGNYLLKFVNCWLGEAKSFKFCSTSLIRKEAPSENSCINGSKIRENYFTRYKKTYCGGKIESEEEFQVNEQEKAEPVVKGPQDVRRVLPSEIKDHLSEKEYQEAMETARSRYWLVGEAKRIRESGQNVTERMRTFAKSKGITVGTLYRWIQASDEGVLGLMNKRPSIETGRVFRSLTPEMESAIQKFYLVPGARPAAVLRKVCKLANELDQRPPGRATVYRYIDHLEATEPDMCCYARKGQEEWAKNYAPHGVRVEPDRVMQIVMGDHHKLDLFIDYGGKAVRPWLTMWFDVASRCPVGWTTSIQANGETISLAMAHMMAPKKRRLIDTETGEIREELLEVGGVPETLYIDNGEDYKSRLKKKLAKEDFSLCAEALDICTVLGIKLVFATPYRPQAKAHIERFFGTVARQFSVEQPGWCGANPSERPANFDEKKLCAQGRLLTLEEVAERIDTWMLNEYLENVHGTIKKKPLEAHLSGEKKNIGWPDPRTLDALRSYKEKAKVYKEGIRRFGRIYWADELAPYVGQNVILRYDPSHVGELHVFKANAGFKGYICTATNAELMKYDASQDDIKRIQKIRKERKAAIRQRLSDIHNDYGTVASVVAERQAKGKRTIVGAKGKSKVSMITPLDQAGRRMAEHKDRKKQAQTPEMKIAVNKGYDPIEAMIFGKAAKK
jgi:Mu transposase, C-terminal./Integrase core domain.